LRFIWLYLLVATSGWGCSKQIIYKPWARQLN
jgi:hypothetical protein